MTNMKKIYTLVAFVLVLAVPMPALAQRSDPAGIDGSLLLCGAGDVSAAALDRFVELAGGGKAKIVGLVVKEDKARALLPVIEGLDERVKKLKGATFIVWPIDDAKEELADATGVWLMHGSVKVWQDALKKHPQRPAFLALLKRSGVVAISGPTSELIGNQGLALLPKDVFDVRSSQEKKESLEGFVAVKVEPGAALLIKERTLSAVGDGATTITLAASKTLPARTITLQGKAQEDLTALRRAAFDRLHSFPPKTVEPPVVPKGTLVIVGGGGSPMGLYKQFIEYAGGPDKAKIVIFPTAQPDPIGNREVVADAFRKAGAKKATVLKGRTLKEVESKEYLDALKEATGLWFDGGRQWRFVDAYENTKALPLMFDVLNRGGVIGGTSAGATIQGDYLARGGVFHNFDIRYEGYERGLGFLKGVAIDQHFSQRKRLPEMTSLMKTYPQYLGIGIDEATAIVVKGSIADVMGKGKVHFYDANRKFDKGQPDFEALPAGGRYDLKARKVLGAAPVE